MTNGGQPFHIQDDATFTSGEVLNMIAELEEAERALADLPDNTIRLAAEFAIDTVARALMSRLTGDDDLWPFDQE